eukprot:337743-Pyramimonas_sp.AAC.1
MPVTRRSNRGQKEVEADDEDVTKVTQSAVTPKGTKRKEAVTPLPKSTSKSRVGTGLKAAKSAKKADHATKESKLSAPVAAAEEPDTPEDDAKAMRFIQRLAETLKLQVAPNMSRASLLLDDWRKT